MKNVLKLTLVLLTSFAFSASAIAGTLSVAGTAKATYNIQSSESSGAGNNTGKGLGITNELNFTAAGELDNGYTWAYSMELDPSSTASANDDTQMTLTTPYGRVGIFVSEGGLNKQLKFSSAAYTAGIDLGIGAVDDPMAISEFNSLQYQTPTGLIPFGTVFNVGFSPSVDKAQSNSGNAAGTADIIVNTGDTAIGAAYTSPNAVSDVTEYSLSMTPIDGLTVNASYMDAGSNLVDAKAQDYEAGVINAKYAIGGFTVGYGVTKIAPYRPSATTAGDEYLQYIENRDWSIGYAINENLSVSIDQSKAERYMQSVAAASGTKTDTTNSQDVQSLQAAYSMGGMTLALAHTNTDGDGFTKEDTTRADNKQTIFAVTMAF